MTRMRMHRQRAINLTRSVGQVARPFLAQKLGISLPTVTNLVRGLMDDGILIEDGFGESQGGRRAALLKLNPQFACAVGVEVSLSGVKTILMDLGGNILARSESRGPVADARTTMDYLLTALEPLVKQAPRGNLKGIGVGVAGLIDREKGISVKFPHSDEWSNVPIGNLLRTRFKVDTVVDNDVQASTLAEFRYGAARGTETFLYLHLGQGIRLGMLVDGKIFHGVHGRAGELGHIVVDEEGPICYCGNYGCLECFASPIAIVNQAREALTKGGESTIASHTGGSMEEIRIESVLSAAAGGDRLALNLLERAAGYIGRVMANIANVFDPSMFVLAGRMVAQEGPLMEIVERVFRRMQMPAAGHSVEIRKSAFPESPCARGAATLVFDRMFEKMSVG
ncbi:MAG TPA: ROK family protein [Planctomycetota bacterium]|nr:ROK family protein [Planctomycetota bacterium]